MLSLKKKSTPNLLLPRIILLVVLDVAVINVSAFLALFIRHEFDYAAMADSGFLDTLAVIAVPNTLMTLALFTLFRLYNSLWGFAGADELAHIFAAAGLAMVIQGLCILPGFVVLPRSFPVLYGMILCMFTVIIRFSYRFLRRIRAHLMHASRQNTMLIGAGQAGALALREFKNSRFSQNKVA